MIFPFSTIQQGCSGVTVISLPFIRDIFINLFGAICLLTLSAFI